MEPGGWGEEGPTVVVGDILDARFVFIAAASGNYDDNDYYLKDSGNDGNQKEGEMKEEKKINSKNELRMRRPH